MSVKCNICGVEKKYSIVEHIKFEHNLNSKKYKELFPNSSTKSEEWSKKNSESLKKVWSNPKYKEKMTKSRKISHNKEEFKKKMGQIVKKRFEETPEMYSGFTNWHKTDKFKEWVVSEERKEKISKTSKERWENDEYKQKTIESIKNKISDGRCRKNGEYKEKMSEIISKLYSEGKVSNEKNKYKTGAYSSKNGETFLYSSSYELESMKLFDSLESIKKWTNKHGIRIKYFYNGINRNYVPDFYVEFINGDSYIFEMKGWETEEVLVKKEFTLKSYPNYKLFYSVDELKNFIYENYENNQNN